MGKSQAVLFERIYGTHNKENCTVKKVLTKLKAEDKVAVEAALTAAERNKQWNQPQLLLLEVCQNHHASANALSVENINTWEAIQNAETHGKKFPGQRDR